MRTFPRSVVASALATSLSFLACAGDRASSAREPVAAQTPSKPPPPPRPWTEAFRKKAVMVANQVRIEGPPGLLDHVVVRQDKEVYDHTVQTTSEGLMQVTALKSGYENYPIRVVLDSMAMDVLERVVVLERSTDGPVIVEATGDVYWRSLEDDAEQRGDSLRWVGERPSR